MDKLMEFISIFENGTYLNLIWYDKCCIGGIVDTIYEGYLESSDEQKEDDEYYACAFRITDIFQNKCYWNIKIGQLIEVSKYRSPDEILLETGETVWKRGKICF
ncbi:MAG: hypothetical protein K6G60_07320 [Lachnospiraceae bacterium]|nr:hypothetical protein [Lachnospiraceae bacterium]